jgi:hypothetical protein
VLTFLASLSGNELKTFPWDRTTKFLILKVHQISEPLKIVLAPGDSTVVTPLFHLWLPPLFQCGCF